MRLLITRLAQLVLVLFVVTFSTFVAMDLLGDPLTNLVGPFAESAQCDGIEPGSPEDVSTRSGFEEGDCEFLEGIREEYGLNDNVVVRYFRWAGDMLTGDFGDSFSQQRPVSDIISERLPITARLAVFAMSMSLLISIPWALLAAFRANRPFDNASTVVSFSLISIPNFAMGVILLYIFAIKFEVFDSRYSSDGWFEEMKSLFLPALTLALPLAATYQRLLRTDLISTLQEDYVHMARAKGMPAGHIMRRHALRPSMFSMITVFGINTGALLGGTVVIEQIFSIPGLGSEIVESIIRDDFQTVLAIVTIIVVAFVVLNMLVDLLYTYLDPRVRNA